MSTGKSAAFLEGRKRAIAFHNYMVSKRTRIREKYAAVGELIPAAEPPVSLDAATDQLSAASIPTAEPPASLYAAADQLSAASIPAAEPPASLDVTTCFLPNATTASQVRRKRGGVQYPSRVTQATHRGHVDVQSKQSQCMQHESVWHVEEEPSTGLRTPVKERDESLTTAVEPCGIGIMQMLASTLRYEVTKQHEFLNSQSTSAKGVNASDSNVADETGSKQDGDCEPEEYASPDSFPVTMLDPPDYSLMQDGYCGLGLFHDL